MPEPLKGYAVLPALACGEIVMGSRASLGPITPEGSSVRGEFREVVKNLAIHTGRDPGLFLGLLDRDADLRAIRTADKQIHYVMADGVEEFARTHQIVENSSAWADGQRGVLLARRAREEGFTKLLSDDILEVFSTYRMAGNLSSDPSLLADPKAVWIKVEGRIDAGMERFVTQRLQQARLDGSNLVFLEVNSEGGLDLPASGIAQQIADLKEIKTVAYVGDRALGMAALIPLACDDIVLRKGAKIGNVTRLMTGGRDVDRDLARARDHAGDARPDAQPGQAPPRRGRRGDGRSERGRSSRPRIRRRAPRASSASPRSTRSRAAISTWSGSRSRARRSR